MTLPSIRGANSRRCTPFRLRCPARALLVLLAAGSAAASAAPIGTNTALPLSADELIAREQLVFSHASDRLNDARRSLDRFEARTVLGYGLTSRLALFGVLPLVDIERESGAARSSAVGLGDASLFARYEVLRIDRPGRTLRLAPYAGVRLPSGRDGVTGDGSTDVFGGLIATLATTQWVLDTQLRYDLNRGAEGFERGDAATLDASFQYRLAPRRIRQDTRGFVFGVLEMRATQAQRSRLRGIEIADSGGFQLSLTPGLQYAARRWIADFGVQVPVVSNLNGDALETDYTLLTSFRINF